MATKKAISADEARWRAESDAHTMAEYEAIMGDSSRRNAAIKAAKSQAADLNKRAAAMNRVAGTTKPTSKKK